MSGDRGLSHETTPDASRTAEKVRLEARLAKLESWQSLQRLRERPTGRSLMAAIEAAAERERIERELADTCADYRAWLSLSDCAREDDAPAITDKSSFKTRVRVKAAAVSVGGNGAESSHLPVKPVRAVTQTAPRSVSRSPSSFVGHGRGAAEEASVTIVRRAKNGRVTRLELPVAGRPAVARERMDRRARVERQLETANDAAPQTIAKRPD